jgi:hypothetical protein
LAVTHDLCLYLFFFLAATHDLFHVRSPVNHDYFISQRAFFWDLSVWDDEAPNDDPSQPLGTDLNTLMKILAAYYTNNPSAVITVSGVSFIVLVLVVVVVVVVIIIITIVIIHIIIIIIHHHLTVVKLAVHAMGLQVRERPPRRCAHRVADGIGPLRLQRHHRRYVDHLIQI